jgi:hypothetical protein
LRKGKGGFKPLKALLTSLSLVSRENLGTRGDDRGVPGLRTKREETTDEQ